MDNATLVTIVAIVGIVIIVVAALLYLRTRRSEALRSRFGPEYDRTVKQSRSRSRAEADLEQRQKRVERLMIRPLPAADKARFTDSWRRIQERFVDDPSGAVAEADQLLGEVMSVRGYPVSDFNQRAADISVDHPRVVENYRTAHDIALRHTRGEASTEELRQAMIHYRTLFLDLVGEPEAEMPHAA